MKKIISLLAVFFLIVCSTLICSNVSAAQEANLIFELDINYSEESGLILSNKALDSEVVSDVTYGTRRPGYDGSPIYAAEETGAGEDGTVEYLTFSYNDGTSTLNRYSHVAVNFTDAYKGGAFANKEPITFEAWARPNSACASGEWGALFGVGTTEHSTGTNAYQFRVNTAAKTYTMYNDIKAASGGRTTFTLDSKHFDKWTHYVITREYDATNSKWINKLYINGTLVGSEEQATTEITDFTTVSDAGKFTSLAIGAAMGTDRMRSFIGDVASFKIYDGLLSDDYIESTYKNELSDYVKLIDATHNLSEIDPDADEFSIYFDESPDTLTVNDEICIKTASGDEVATKLVNYDATSKTAVFNLLDYLNAGETYTLCLDNVKDANGLPLKNSKISFTAKVKSNALTANHPVGTLKDTNGQITESIAQAKTAHISMDVSNNSSTDKKVVMAMIIYDSSGRLVKMIRTADTLISAGEQNLTLEVTTDGDTEIELGEGYKIKSIAWSVEENTGAIAFSAPVELY